MRQQIDLYRNDDVINELEKKLAGMNIEESKKSQVQSALDSGKGKVGKDERKVVKASRKTEEGRGKHAESEEARKREEALIKATLKEKGEKGDEDDDGWDSVEEDFPHIKLDDLKNLNEQLAGMKIQGDDDDDEGDDDDFEDEEDEKPAASKGAAAKKKEEAKKPSKK
jgi:hypothetical protein